MSADTDPQALRPLLSPPVDNASPDLEDTRPATQPPSRRRDALMRPRVYIPTLIILWQSAVLVFGWVFYGIMRNTPMPLPDGLAIAARDNPQSVTFIVTLIATLISLSNGYLKLAAKSPIFSLRHWKWTIATLACVTALGAQTAGYSTVLSPRRITRETTVTGFGVDMGNSEFITQMISDADAGRHLPMFFVIVLLISRAGGILLANLVPMTTLCGATYGAQLPANAAIASQISSPQGFQTNYTVTQQGLTADVHCEQVEAVIGCRNGISIYSSHLTFPVNDDFTGDPVGNGIFSGICVYDNHTRHEVVLVGTGNYNWIPPTICTFSSKVTRLDVRYSKLRSESSFDIPDLIELSEPWEIIGGTAAGHAPAHVIRRALTTSYDLGGSVFGDSLVSFFVTEIVQGKDRNEVLNFLLETWIKGILEFGATPVRAAYTENSTSLFGEPGTPIHEEFRYTINGTFVTETTGWHQPGRSAPVVLLAPTFVTSLSIFIILFALVRASHDTRVKGQDYFDLNDPLHVIAAASVGGIRDPFPPFDAGIDAEIAHSERVKVRLGHTEAGRLGLIEYCEDATPDTMRPPVDKIEEKSSVDEKVTIDVSMQTVE
ncbi:hypothetical protein AX16_005682 [Volvariella volvacea WC 439]|nr:hypothetical protein AX16_005682 [Volvariella volvacea WC 439]